MGTVAYTTLIKPIKGEQVSGDASFIREFDGKVFMAMIDAAGHGPEAKAVADKALLVLEENYKQPDITKIITTLHEVLKGGDRGLVIGIVVINVHDGIMYFTGVGNIETKIIGTQDYTMVPRDGVIGYQITRPRWEAFLLNSNDLVIMHSDGISAYFGKGDYPAMIRDEVEVVAATMVNEFGKDHDDVGCIVLRYTS